MATERLHIIRHDHVCGFPSPRRSDTRGLLDSLYARNGQSLNELCEGQDLSRQAVTKHLAIPEEANLVVTLKRGREKLPFLTAVPIHEIADRWIGKFERAPAGAR
jgi:DNA-binding transcriptional ArsR family regulator